MSKKAISLNERVERVRRAVYQTAYSTNTSDEFYVEYVYEGYVIVRDYPDGIYWRANYTETSEGVTVQPRAEWQRVEKEWAAKATVLARNNQALKALGNGKVGGYLVLFSSADDPDLAGDYFDATTDFDIEDGQKTAVYYQHGLDDTLKRRKLGTGTLKQDDIGIWLEAQLELRDGYEQAIYGLVEAGKCGLSSGTAAHLVEREPAGSAFHIKYWPLGLDASITPTPCEPRTSVLPLKSLIESTTPQATPQAAGDAATADATATEIQSQSQSLSHEEFSSMTEEQIKALIADAIKSGNAEQLEALKAMMESAPAVKSAGVDVPNVIIKQDEKIDALKAFNHYLLTGDVAPYKAALKASPMVEGTPASGGYLVPTQYSNELIVALQRQSYLRQAGARIMQVSGTTSFRMPKLTNSGAAVLTGEGLAYNEAGPDVGEVEFKPYKYTRITRVTEELEADSRIEVFSQIIQPDIAYAFVQAENPAFTSGTGTNQPQGIVTGATNTQLAVGSVSAVTGDQLIAHQFRLAAPYQLGAKWMMNFDTLGKIRMLKDSQGRYLWAPGLDGNVAGSLLGKPIVINDSLPNMGASAKFLLYGDFSYFVIADWAGMGVQRLGERYAELGQVGFRTFRRFDSKVVLAEAIQSLQNSAT